MAYTPTQKNEIATTLTDLREAVAENLPEWQVELLATLTRADAVAFVAEDAYLATLRQSPAYKADNARDYTLMTAVFDVFDFFTILDLDGDGELGRMAELALSDVHAFAVEYGQALAGDVARIYS